MRSLIALLIAVLALSITAPQVQAVKRTIVGTSSGWMPLKELAAQVGMSEGYVDQIIDANLALSCQYPKKNGTLMYMPANAWVLNDNIQHIYTHAHVILVERQRLKKDLADCKVDTARDRMESDQPQAFRFEADPASILMGLPIDAAGNVLGKWNTLKDRARLTLKDVIPNLVPLDAAGFNGPASLFGDFLKVGQLVILVSNGGPFGADEMVAQSCTAKKMFPSGGGYPGGLFTDCSNQGGISGGLYFVEDLGSCRDVAGDKECDWIPVAMHSGGIKKDPDNSPWNEKTNSSIGIVISREFFAYANR